MTLPPFMRLLKLRAPALRTAPLLAVALLAASPCSGITWYWSYPTPHGNDIYDMAWNGNLSVQVCDSGQVYTGTDFLGWTPQNSGTTNDLESVTFFGDRIVIVGASGTVGYSDDGVTFTTTNLSTLNNGWLVGVAASSNLVVAVGDYAVIYTSSDGANWHYQGQAPDNSNGEWLLSVAWGAGVFVATGTGGYVATSTNGTNWTSRTSGTSDDLTCVAYASNAPGAFPDTGFYAASYESQGFYSTNNGNTWTGIVPSNTNVFWTVAANNTTALVAGDSDVLLGTNTVPLDWRRQSDPAVTEGVPVPTWTYYAALWDSTNCVYRLGGEDGMMVDGTPTNGAYAWPMQYDSERNLLWEVTVAGNYLYVAVGEHAGIMTSDNGGDWSVEYVPLTNSVSISNTVFLCVGGTTNLLIAAGTSGSLAVSPNVLTAIVLTNGDGSVSTNQVSALGVLWYSLPAPTTSDLAGLCAFNSSFFLAGSGATMLRSANGTNWTKVSLPTTVTNDLAGLAASTNLIVGVGDQGTIITSPDGNTWTSRTSGTASGLIRVRYLDGLFLAVGENGTILRSTNGTSWSASTSDTTNWLNDAVMVTNTCYIVGNNGTVLASTNFVNWTNIGCITYQSLYGAATQNGQLVAVGLGGTILRSQVVPNLTPIFFYYYAQSSGENIFYVSGYPGQSFTLDSSTNLINWTTGPTLNLVYGSGTLAFVTSLGANPPPRQFYRATLVP